MITNLNTNIQKFTNIIHCADIHIKLSKRHDEYKEVFKKLYTDVKNSSEKTAVFILGDVFHNKISLSPESVDLASEFLFNLASLRPTVLVAGNHDLLISSKNRLDSLSPIVSALNHSNLFYLKKSGLYSLGNICINNYSIFDDTTDKYLKGKDIPKNYRNQYEHFVCLFHGQVDGSVTELGFKLTNPIVPVSIFNGHDMVLCGDIHLEQTLQEYDYYQQNNNPIIRFCGSTISQNHGESGLGHGYSLWDLENKTYKHIEIPNDYGYFSVLLDHGIICTDLKNIPKKARIRFQLKNNTKQTEIKDALIEIKKITEVIESCYQNLDSGVALTRIPSSNGNVVLLGDINDKNYQVDIIKEYLKTKLQITDDNFIKGIVKINDEINDKIKKDDFPKNIRWKPIKFEFDNLFSYGTGNVIDFTKMKNVVGLFSPNASGKSSIASSLTYCIWDKCERDNKAINIMNIKSTEFFCKFEFEIDGKRYFIKRVGKTDKKGKVKVDVKFWKIENGEEVDINGEQRKDTNEIIREYIGCYDDFVLTSLSVQNGKNNASVIDMGNTDRKDLFAQFMGLTIFDKLYTEANEKLKEKLITLKNYKNNDYTQKLIDYTNFLGQAEGVYKQETEELNNIQKKSEELQQNIITENKKLIKININEIVSLTTLEKNKINYKRNLDLVKQNIKNQEDVILDTKKIIEIKEVEIKSFEGKNITSVYKKYQEFKLNHSVVQNKFDKLKICVDNELKIVAKAKDYKYNSECEYCIINNGKIVSDAEVSKKKLEEYKKQIVQLNENLEEINKNINLTEWSSISYDKYQELLNERNTTKDNLNNAISKKSNWEEDLNESENNLKTVENKIEEYNKNKESIEFNEKINIQINSFKQDFCNVEYSYKVKNKSIMDVNGKILVCKNKIDEINKNINDVKIIEDEYKLYEVYCQAVSRDGVPFDVITATVPEIQNEVNNILSQIADFTTLFETDDKNIIPYIVYDNQKWIMGLTSGYEKFALSLAIRVALLKVSNLQKSNFLIIDESFGVLDSENICYMNTLFSYLKNNFDFIIIISHIDSLKDCVDNLMEITKDTEGFSKVEFI